MIENNKITLEDLILRYLIEEILKDKQNAKFG